MVGSFELTFAGVPFLLDSSKVVRMPSHRAGEAEFVPSMLEPPAKHQPEADLIDELDRLLTYEYLQDFSLPSH